MIKYNIIIPAEQAITILSMAGIHHGPYMDIPGDLYSATSELFQFAQIHTALAQEYLSIVEELLYDNHIIFIAIASFNDEVVPLYSAILQHFDAAPGLYRGIWYKALTDAFFKQLFSSIMTKASGNHDLLLHISGLFRGSIFNRKLFHSEIHHDITPYENALNVSYQHDTINAIKLKSNINNRRNYQSFILFNSLLTDSFVHSPLNQYLIFIRLQEFWYTCDIKERNKIWKYYIQWIPLQKSHKILALQLRKIHQLNKANL